MVEGLKIRFVSSNPHKLEEAKSILEASGVLVTAVNLKIDELQTEDTITLVRNKALEVFRLIGRPLFVEHTGLYLAHLNGLPAGLTQIFWDRLQADRFSELFGETDDNRVKARTDLCFVDGKRLHFFEGEVEGRVSSSPRGDRGFQWDCVFIPDGYDETFAEMGERKNEISMRRRALDSFSSFLSERGYA